MPKKTNVAFIIAGLATLVLAIILIANIIRDSGYDKVHNPKETGASAPASTTPSAPGTKQGPDPDNRTPFGNNTAKEATPTGTDTQNNIPDDEITSDGFIQLDEIIIAGDDGINVVNDIGRNISEIIRERGEPEAKEVFYASDAYIYNDITFITEYEEEAIIKIFVWDPYKFGDFKIGNSVKSVKEMFGKPYISGFSDEDGLWYMAYRTEDHNIIFYSESEFGNVIAIGIEIYRE